MWQTVRRVVSIVRLYLTTTRKERAFARMVARDIAGLPLTIYRRAP